MTVDAEVYDFLEHRGVKGMRWGVRKARGDRTAFSERSKKQKAAILGVGTVAGLAGVKLIMGKTLSLPLSAIGGAAAATAGVALTKKMLDKHGDTNLSELSEGG